MTRHSRSEWIGLVAGILVGACAASSGGGDPYSSNNHHSDAGTQQDGATDAKEAGRGGSAGKAGSGAGGGGAGGGANGGSGGAAGAGTCDEEVIFKSPSCGSCRSSAATGSCTGSRSDCVKNADCKTMLECWDGCNDAACRENCSRMKPQALTALVTYLGCVGSTCYDKCYCTMCKFKFDGCAECMKARCLDSCATCHLRTDCTALDLCLTYACASDDQKCRDDCSSEVQTGGPPYQDLRKCAQDKCSGTCAGE